MTDSGLATSSYDQTARIWDPITGAITGAQLHTLVGHAGPAWWVAWSPDSRHLATAGDDRTVQVWMLEATATHLRTLTGHIDIVRSVAWSPNGRRLATASNDKTVRIWDPTTGKCVCTFKGHNDGTWSVAWSPDSRHLASSDNNGTIRIWPIR